MFDALISQANPHANALEYWLQNYTFISFIRPAHLCADVSIAKDKFIAFSHPANRFIAWSKCKNESIFLWKNSNLIAIEPEYETVSSYCFKLKTKYTVTVVPYVSWLHTTNLQTINTLLLHPKNIHACIVSNNKKNKK